MVFRKRRSRTWRPLPRRVYTRLWTLAELGVLDDERFLFHVDAILKTPRVDVEDEPSDRDRLPGGAGPGHGVEALRNADQHRVKSCPNVARHFVERFRERDGEQGSKPIDRGDRRRASCP